MAGVAAGGSAPYAVAGVRRQVVRGAICRGWRGMQVLGSVVVLPAPFEIECLWSRNDRKSLRPAHSLSSIPSGPKLPKHEAHKLTRIHASIRAYTILTIATNTITACQRQHLALAQFLFLVLPSPLIARRIIFAFTSSRRLEFRRLPCPRVASGGWASQAPPGSPRSTAARPAPAPARRRPLPSQSSRTVWDLHWRSAVSKSNCQATPPHARTRPARPPARRVLRP